MTKRNEKFYTLMYSLVIIFCLGTAELTLSFAGYSGEISFQGKFLTHDPQWSLESWWNKNNKRRPMPTVNRVRALTKDSRGSIDINDHVFPIEKVPGKKRVLFIGDSGTYGSGVSEENTFVNLVRQSLDNEHYEVINAGVPGYTPTQSFFQLKEHLIYMKPDHVIYTIFLANDVLDLLDDPFLDKWNKYIIRGPQWRWFQSSAIINFLRLGIAKILYKIRKPKDDIYKISRVDENGIRMDHNSCTGRYRSYLLPLHPKLHKLWSLFEREIIVMRDYLKNRNIPFSILIYPTHTILSGKFIYIDDGNSISCIEKSGLKYEPEKLDSELPLKKILDICHNAELTCFNSIPKIKKQLGLKFYLQQDDHASPEGHKVLSEILLENKEHWLRNEP